MSTTPATATAPFAADDSTRWVVCGGCGQVARFDGNVERLRRNGGIAHADCLRVADAEAAARLDALREETAGIALCENPDCDMAGEPIGPSGECQYCDWDNQLIEAQS